MTDPIRTATIRNVQVPMIAHADIKRMPTLEGDVRDDDFSRALEAMNDRRLQTPENIHLYEGDAQDLGHIATDGTLVLHAKRIRSIVSLIAKKEQVPPGRVSRLFYRDLLDGFTPDRLKRFNPDKAKLQTLREEAARNARRSEVLPLLAFPATTLSYKPERRVLVGRPQRGLW